METYQLIDWYAKDEKDENYIKSYNIYAMGLSLNDESVAIKITGFEPFFYVSIPQDWNESMCKKFIRFVKKEKDKKGKKLIGYCGGDLTGITITHKCRFEGFTNNMKYKFMKLTFRTHNASKTYARVIKTIIDKENYPMKLYESTLDPMLRFFHLADFKPSGFIQMDPDESLEEDEKKFNVDHEYVIPWNEFESFESSKNAPLLIASYDIECDSSHGDFPLAKKDLRKLVCEVHAEYNRLRLLLEVKKQPCHWFEGEDFLRIDFIAELLYLGFKNNKYGIGVRDEYNISEVFTKENKKPSKEEIKTFVEGVFGSNTENLLNFQELKGHKKEEIICKLVGTRKIKWGLDKENNPPTSYYKKTYKSYDDLPDWIGNKFPEIEEILSGLEELNIEVEGDPIIQIGTVFYKTGDHISKMERTIITLGTCDDIPDDNGVIKPIVCETESQVLKEWSKLIKNRNPQFITGYNIFGFDFKYIYDRAKELKIHDDPEFYEMGLLVNNDSNQCQLTHKQLSSSALGDNSLYYIEMKGRVLLDLQKEVQKEYNLGSYKLDNVAAEFMRGKIIKSRRAQQKNKKTLLFTDNLGTLKEGKYIKIIEFNTIGEQYYNNGQKFKIKTLKDHTHKIVLIEGTFEMKAGSSYKWCEAKDDITPQDIFAKQKQGSKERAEIAKYCIQDCELCLHLISRFESINRNISMGNVCYVPTSFIYLRGQGVKIFSLVVKTSSNIPENVGTLIDTKHNKFMDDEEEIEEGTIRNDGYEGAIVLKPNGPGKDGGGIYTDRPISVLDFASLYPSSMIERNLSHETVITETMLRKNPKVYSILDKTEAFSKLYFTINGQTEEYSVTRIEYDNYCYKFEKKIWRKLPHPTKPTVICWYVDKKHTIGIIPYVVDTLLKQRKATKKALKEEQDPERKKILDGQQLAYKLTANSTYGQIGAKTSQIYLQDIAACTTATGREHIMTAVAVVEKEFTGCKVVYGDTDSIFVDFTDWVHNHPDSKYKDKNLKDKELLAACIETANAADKVFLDNNVYNKPQHLEYEKTFWPFIQITKKRYTGDKYEFDTNKFSRTSMGLVTKRRDNAPIVKYIFGNVVEIIMKEKSVVNAVVWLKKELLRLAKGEFDTSMFIVSKTLRGHYKNPQGIAHKVLADRIADRDPGNKPASNDRIPYAYIECLEAQKQAKLEKKPFLQGDHIEHPDFIKEQELKIDYAFYITNQIQVPVSQILELAYKEQEVLEMFNESLDCLNPEIKYFRMPVGELRALCKEKGLISKGTKEAIIKYLLDPENTEYKQNPMEEEYNDMSAADLRVLCVEKGLISKGTKEVIIKYLLDPENPDWKDKTNYYEEGLLKKKKVELEALCIEKGLNKKGLKIDLVKRLVEAEN